MPLSRQCRRFPGDYEGVANPQQQISGLLSGCGSPSSPSEKVLYVARYPSSTFYIATYQKALSGRLLSLRWERGGFLWLFNMLGPSGPSSNLPPLKLSVYTVRANLDPQFDWIWKNLGDCGACLCMCL